MDNTKTNLPENVEMHKPDIPICRRCGRVLKDPVSIERSMGMVCYAKHVRETSQRPLFGSTNKK